MPSTPDTPMNERHHINVFTHNDLDGVACAVLAELYAKQKSASITVAYCTPGTINHELEKLEHSIKTAKFIGAPLPSLREIFVLDLALDAQGVAIMDRLLRDGIRGQHIDHHPMKTTTKYPWMMITSSPVICACDLLVCYLRLYRYASFNYATIDFSNRVSIWDTHRFPSYERKEYEDLNLVLKLLGPKGAHEFFTGALIEEPNQPLKIKDTYLAAAVDELRRQKNEYCAIHGKRPLVFFDHGRRIHAVFADKHISSVADYVLDHQPDADICAVIQMPICVSLRTRNSDIDLFEDYAKPRGGWGHASAAAFPIRDLVDSELLAPVMNMWNYAF